jgi:hypothetical protein
MIYLIAALLVVVTFLLWNIDDNVAGIRRNQRR